LVRPQILRIQNFFKIFYEVLFIALIISLKISFNK
jgi:hypothetical protein